jgi:hypothetical protein
MAPEPDRDQRRDVEIRQSADGTVSLDVKTDGDTLWLT